MAFQGKGKIGSELRTAGSSVETPTWDVSGASRGDLGEERPPHGVARLQQRAPTPQEEPADTRDVLGDAP